MTEINRDREADLEKLADAFFECLEMSRIEFGGIGLDGKRPFGSSNPETDILQIIGMKPANSNGYTEEEEEYAENLYREHLIYYLRSRWEKDETEEVEKETTEKGKPASKPMTDAELMALSAYHFGQSILMQADNQSRESQGLAPAWDSGCGDEHGDLMLAELERRGVLGGGR